MARLAQLRLSMSVAIFLVAVIFFIFLVVIMYLFRLPLIFAFLGTLLFIFVEYLIGPVIVRSSTRLRYFRHGEHPWLDSTVRELAQMSEIPAPKLAIVPDPTPNAFVFGRTTRGATLAFH